MLDLFFTLQIFDLHLFSDFFSTDLQFDCVYSLYSRNESKHETPAGVLLICWWIHFSHFVFLLLKLPMDGGGSVSDAVLVVQAIDSTGVMVV